MSEAYLGEIRIFAGGYAPIGWEFCAGQLLSIAQNDALFALLGVTYGGDGINTFALPDLRGRSAVHAGTMPADGRTYVMGDRAGVEEVVIGQGQMPAHTHLATVASPADGTTPEQRRWAAQAPFAYASAGPGVQMAAAVQPSGGGTPHENMPPYLAVSFIICTSGLFPSQN